MLTKKIEKSKQDKELEKKRKEFIDKGADVISEKSESQWIMINLRIRKDMLHKIDDLLNNERIGISRTGWILESIQEKLKKENV